jgi:hypothetical protein
MACHHQQAVEQGERMSRTRTRLERAIEIRDHVLPLIRAGGRVQSRGGLRWTKWSPPGFNCVLITPFTPLPAGSRPSSYERAIAQHLGSKGMPWRLDIWSRGTGKVLSLQWDDEQADLISMKSGLWEAKLLALKVAARCEPIRGFQAVMIAGAAILRPWLASWVSTCNGACR